MIKETYPMSLFFFNFLPFVLFVECLLLWFSLKSLTGHTWSKGDLGRSLLVLAKLWSVWPQKKKKLSECKRGMLYLDSKYLYICVFCWHFKNNLAILCFYHGYKWHIISTQKKAFKAHWQGAIYPPAISYSN